MRRAVVETWAETPPEASASIRLVAACADDFETLATLRIEAMRESLQPIGRFDPARSRERLRAGFSAEHTFHIEAEGRRIGFVVIKLEADGLRLDHLYVSPPAQRRGIGGTVLAQVFARADAQGLPSSVSALRGSDANRFYERHGFVRVGEGEFDIHYTRAGRPRPA